MFKTILVGLGALIIGMLVYLYSELSSLRNALEASSAQLSLTIEKESRPLLVKLSTPKRIYTFKIPARCVIQNGVIKNVFLDSSFSEPSAEPELPPASSPASVEEQ